MNYTLRKWCAVSLLISGLTEAQAQVAIPSTGGTAIGAGGTINYSVGQVFLSTATGSEGSLSEGTIQPYEISLMMGNEENGINVSFYPNPTLDKLILEVPEIEVSFLSYELHDVNGNLLQGRQVSDVSTNIEMGDLPSAMYYLSVTNRDKQLKVFKIIKR